MVAFTEQAARSRSTLRRGWITVSSDLLCLQQPIVNVALFGEPHAGDRGWVLIDAGLPFSAETIHRAAEQRFGIGARPSAIILTHGHFDHVGALLTLADQWDVPIYAHRLELPYLDGRCSYPPPDPFVGGGAMAWMSPLYPRGPIDVSGVSRELPADHSLPGMHGWRWLHTPGHTPGHVSLFRESDRSLIVGDAFVTTRQESLIFALLQPQHVSRPPAYYTVDWQSAHRSIIELTMLDPSIALAGHGQPMHGSLLHEQLQELGGTFARESIPRLGRYSWHPATANENGVLSVPPPVISNGVLLAGLALVAVATAGVLTLTLPRRSKLQMG